MPHACEYVSFYSNHLQNSWEIIETEFPWVFCQGCAAHLYNLLIKDILQEPEFAILLRQATDCALFVKYRQAVLRKYKLLMEPMGVVRGLSIPVDTRWYTQYHCMNNLVLAKQIVMAIKEDDPLMASIKGQQLEKKEKFMETVIEPSFWNDLKVYIYMVN
jgi:hypothetical protein